MLLPRGKGDQDNLPSFLPKEFFHGRTVKVTRGTKQRSVGKPGVPCGDPGGGPSSLCHFSGSGRSSGSAGGEGKAGKELTGERQVHGCFPEPGSMSGTRSRSVFPRQRAGAGGRRAPHPSPPHCRDLPASTDSQHGFRARGFPPRIPCPWIPSSPSVPIPLPLPKAGSGTMGESRGIFTN